MSDQKVRDPADVAAEKFNWALSRSLGADPAVNQAILLGIGLALLGISQRLDWLASRPTYHPQTGGQVWPPRTQGSE